MVTMLTNNSEPKSNCVWQTIRYNLTSTATPQLTYKKLCHLRSGAWDHYAILTQSSKSFVRIHPTVVLIVVHYIFGVQRWNKKLKVVWSCHFSRPSHWTESAQTPSTCQFLILAKLMKKVDEKLCCEKCQKINCGVAASVFQLITCLIRRVFSQQARKNKSETPGDASQAYLTDIADVASINSSSLFIILCIISFLNV